MRSEMKLDFVFLPSNLKENMCAEIKKLPPSSNKPADGKLSEMATTIPRMVRRSYF